MPVPLKNQWNKVWDHLTKFPSPVAYKTVGDFYHLILDIKINRIRLKTLEKISLGSSKKKLRAYSLNIKIKMTK